MKPTVAVMSYRRLTRLMQTIDKQYTNRINLLYFDTLLDGVLEEALRLEKNQEADVFISAGGNARLLVEHLKSPFVEIHVTGFDIMRALEKAHRRPGKIGVMTFKSKLPYLDRLKGILNCKIVEYTYDSLESIDSVLENMKKSGIDTVVGSSLVIERAKEKSMHGVFIYSTEGVERALEAAEKIAISKKLESERAERFRVILDFAYSGIMATDREGRVTAFNPAAEKTIGIPKHKVIGQYVDKVIPNTKLYEVMKKARPEFNQLQTIGDIKVYTNRIPIIVNDEVIGTVATFQDIGAIQKAEATIRKRLYEKGFIARASLDDIVGDSPAIIEAKKEAYLYGQTDSTILIVGETGTGKELFAQGIHNAGCRSKRPFIAVNCAALPESLLESELFGYEEGAFTGARKGGKPGYFELAHGGTVFLDEISEISPRMQARLLRVLEEHEVMRVGGDSILPINIRVLVATNKKLWEMVEQGTFREDLYYRINVLQLTVPPLRKRGNDAIILASHFIKICRNDLDNRAIDKILAHPLFKTAHWPGNVRELKNVIERVAVLYDSNSRHKLMLDSYTQKDQYFETGYLTIGRINEAMIEARGNKSEAAKRLGISRTSLWRKLKAAKGD